MSYPDKVTDITRLVTPLAASLGLVVWGVELSGTNRPVARIYVDTPPASQTQPAAEPLPDAETAAATAAPALVSEEGAPATLQSETPQGVSIDQCAELSRLLGLALDVEDPFATGWILEVSSPGFERPFFAIDQLRDYIGRELVVVLASPMDDWPGRKNFSGILTAVLDEEFTLALPPAKRLESEPEHVTIAWHTVRKANLIHHFPEQGKKPGGNPKQGAKKAGKAGGSGKARGGNA